MLIDRIETNTATDSGQSPQGIKYRVKRPLNNFEIEVRDKINEIVDKFNQLFPI